jgi:hypothetical protein
MDKNYYRLVRQTASEIRITNSTPGRYFKRLNNSSDYRTPFREHVENELKAQKLAEKAKCIRQSMLLAEGVHHSEWSSILDA